MESTQTLSLVTMPALYSTYPHTLHRGNQEVINIANERPFLNNFSLFVMDETAICIIKTKDIFKSNEINVPFHSRKTGL